MFENVNKELSFAAMRVNGGDHAGELYEKKQAELQEEKPSGGVTSWNDLQDKPFGEEQAFEPIVLPDMIDKSVSFDARDIFGISDNAMLFYKVNCLPAPFEAYDGATITCQDSDLYYAKVDVFNAGTFDGVGVFVASTMAEDYEGTITDYTIDYIAVVTEENPFGMPSGVYAFRKTNISAKITIAKRTIKPLDEKYLPTLTSPSGKKFKLTVDDNGTISATEV